MKMITERQDYNCKDAFATRKLFDCLYPQLDDKTRRVYEAEMGLQGVAMAVGLRGLHVDTEVRREIVTELAAEQKRLREEIGTIAQTELFGAEGGVSTKKLGVWLYDVLGLKEQFGHKTGTRTTGEDALLRIAKRAVALVPKMTIPEKTARKDAAATVATNVLEIRDLGKQSSSLTDALLEDGRMRTTLVVGGTESYRFSSHKTWNDRGHNQQNVDKRLRRCFIPDPGFVFVGQDQERAESMTVAYCAGDEEYIRAHEKNTHVIVARILWPDLPWTGDEEKDEAFARSYTLDGKPKKGRNAVYDKSKACQHGSNYLMSAPGLAHHAQITIEAAEEAQERYFGRFAGIAAWHREVIGELQATGVVTCPGGFKRVFFGRRWDAGTHREAISFIPQAVIAWSNHLTMFRFYNELESEDFNVLGHCHDSVLCQVRKERLAEYLPHMEELSAVEWSIRGRAMRIKWERKTGSNWSEV